MILKKTQDPSSNLHLLCRGYNFRWGTKLSLTADEAVRAKGSRAKTKQYINTKQFLNSWHFGDTWFHPDKIGIVSVSQWKGIICMRKHLQHLCNASWPTWRYQPLHWQNAIALRALTKTSVQHTISFPKQCETRQRVKIVSGRPWIAVGWLI